MLQCNSCWCSIRQTTWKEKDNNYHELLWLWAVQPLQVWEPSTLGPEWQTLYTVSLAEMFAVQRQSLCAWLPFTKSSANIGTPIAGAGYKLIKNIRISFLESQWIQPCLQTRRYDGNSRERIFYWVSRTRSRQAWYYWRVCSCNASYATFLRSPCSADCISMGTNELWLFATSLMKPTIDNSRSSSWDEIVEMYEWLVATANPLI